MPDKEQSIVDIAAAGVSGAMLAAVFQAIRASREHAGETFNARRFAVGIASAGGVGAVTVAPEMLPVLIGNRGTDAELDSFEKNWSSVYGNKSVGELI